jgi:uncharacterized protein YfdQ (DUF2303 family)
VTDPTPPTSDLAAVLDAQLADRLAERLDLTADTATIVPLPNDWQWFRVSGEFLASTPRRSTGVVTVHSAAAFQAALTRFADPATTGIYADENNARLTAVLNDDTRLAAGWRDRRIDLNLVRTPEWDTWLRRQGVTSQQEFADHIESNIDDIVQPTQAEMLEIAQRFDATIDVQFKAGHRLTSGQRELVWTERVNATAGSITIPDRFAIGVRVFVGGPAYRIDALLKYAVRDGGLKIGYTLVRPHDVERAAFNDIVADIATDTVDVIAGVPAPPIPERW